MDEYKYLISQSEVPAIPSDAFTHIKEGSYAIVIFGLLMFFFVRKDLTALLKGHMELLKHIEETIDAVKDNNSRLVESVSRLTETNEIIANILQERLRKVEEEQDKNKKTQ